MPPTRKFPTQRLHTIKTHNAPVNAICFSSSPGTYILTGSSDRSVHLCRALPESSTTVSATTPITTTPIQRYAKHGYSVLDLAVTADNARFASVGGDKQVFLWDVETGTTVRRWSGHDARVEAVEFGAEADSIVASGSADKTLKLWDTRSLTSKPIQTLTEARDTISSLSIHTPTASIISGSYDGRIRSYDLRMGMVNVDVMGHEVTSVRCSDDGNVVLASCLDGWIRMVDRTDGTVLKAFGGRGSYAAAAAAASGQAGSDSAAATTDRDETPRYVNSSLRIRSSFGMGDSIVFSGGETDEKESALNVESHVFVWDVLTGDVITRVGAGQGVKAVSCVAWNEKGGKWAGGCSDGKLVHS
ncbi:mitogen-activated protein kinase organizer 1 [Blastomyces parvus]|uniref:Mitogen-activated protein kinase organizer 1 n=1 Tax=Blastomyces parvus TaxID=2060905 RepID=A0A2B7WX28_9EURO|nr:mitogen-activated protein kinase organizer 1 [Blastomyces parvus]